MSQTWLTPICRVFVFTVHSTLCKQCVQFISLTASGLDFLLCMQPRTFWQQSSPEPVLILKHDGCRCRGHPLSMLCQQGMLMICISVKHKWCSVGNDEYNTSMRYANVGTTMNIELQDAVRCWTAINMPGQSDCNTFQWVEYILCVG